MCVNDGHMRVVYPLQGLGNIETEWARGRALLTMLAVGSLPDRLHLLLTVLLC